MQHEVDYNNLGLYLLRNTIVKFSNGQCLSGMLRQVLSTSQEIMLDDKTYSLHDISDIEMTGSITYHTYADGPQTSYDIDNLYFGPDDFVPGTDYSKLRFGEFDCIAACHLVFAESIISAKDIRILSLSHKIYLPSLEKAPYLYLLQNGGILVGTMQNTDGLSVCTADGLTTPIHLEDVQDLIRLPLTNEFVEITRRDGSVISGTVSGTDGSMIVLIGDATQGAQGVQLADLLSLRYRGKVSVSTRKIQGKNKKWVGLSLSRKDEVFLCKQPYFRSVEEDNAAVNGAIASFVPGVTDHGLIAKDVVVETKKVADDAGELETGVMLTRTFNGTEGYIGKEFVTKTYCSITHSSMPLGNARFGKEDLLFDFEPYAAAIYVVKYRCNRRGGISWAQDIELKETFPVSDYAKVWIDESGATRKLHISVLLVDKFPNQTVDVEMENGQQLSGKLLDVGDTEIVLNSGDERMPIKKEDILRVFYYGKVTAYQPYRREGYIDGQHWFDVKGFVNSSDESGLEVGTPVRFTFKVSNKGDLRAAANIEILTESSEKKGYVLKYVAKGPEHGFGFIIPPELLEDRLKRNDRRGTIYFRKADIENPGAFKINTTERYYLVSYSEVENDKAHHVKFLEEHLFEAEGASKPTATPVEKNAEIKTHTEVKTLSDTLPSSAALAGARYEYGLINIFSSHYALINQRYYNRDYAPNGVYDREQTVYFNPEDVTVVPDSRLKTNKYNYLVCYVRKSAQASDPEHTAIDNDYPVEVVGTFLKRDCASMLLDNGKITIEYVEGATPMQADPSKPTEAYDDAPELMVGESIYVEGKDGSAFYGIFVEEDDETYLFSDGKRIGKSTIGRLFRFGVITALDLKSGTATINNIFDFSLSDVAEPKMVNILRNQKNRVRLHVMYSYAKGKVTGVCRISESCLNCLAWDDGTVTESDAINRIITVDSSITHYLTVMSDGVNPYVNNKTLKDRDVFLKKVSHPYLSSDEAEPGLAAEPDIVTMAVDVRCQEEELEIQYDEGKGNYFGSRNATISFPVFGSPEFLRQSIGKKVLVSFRTSADRVSLEGYAGDDADEALANVDPTEEDSPSGIREEALSLLLLQGVQREEIERELPDGIHLRPDGKLSDEGQVQQVIEFLLNRAKVLPAAKIAMEHPDCKPSADIDRLLEKRLRARCTTIARDANSCYGEQTYYLSTLLRYPERPDKNNKKRTPKYTKYNCLYWLFSQDFGNREDLAKYMQAGHHTERANLVNLFNKGCSKEGELVAHIVLLDKRSMDTVSSIIRNNKDLADRIKSYARGVDATISGDDVVEVVRALQETYQRDKRRFSEKVIALIGTQSVCKELAETLGNMQVRFLKLVCGDDRERFVQLKKICEDAAAACDYDKNPGFSQREQLLQNAYRDIMELEKEIQAHPFKESAEILLSSGQIDIASNILTSVKEEILVQTNQLYQEHSAPRIRCKANETTIRPDSTSFWLLIENGNSDENLQSAENLSIELESFTDGFMPQKQVRLTRNKLSCGEQLVAKIEIELEDGMSGVLEFGWTASYECTTAFGSDGKVKRRMLSRESEQALQLQIDTAVTHRKDYRAENPYKGPADGQPLNQETKEMFFGREAEKRDILDCICKEDAGGKGFIPGSAVIIFGQKKTGKTSLVYRIKDSIKDDKVLSDKAILLNFNDIPTLLGGTGELKYFRWRLYADIMHQFKDKVEVDHPDVKQMLDEHGVVIPEDLMDPRHEASWPVEFGSFFRKFNSLDQGRHSVILVMDEFTRLCAEIQLEIKKTPSLRDLPTFIKTFSSEFGFIQIIIGHESMIRVLNELGVLNHTKEFARVIEIFALDDVASRELVTKPMIDKFGYDVYGSELGKQAVDRLLDLSGRNPTFLMKLCNQMFKYYTDPNKCPGTQLLLSDVNAMVQEYTENLGLAEFDILLTEDGDDVEGGLEKLMTYRYLKKAAQLSLASYDKRTVDSGEISRELSRELSRERSCAPDSFVAEIEETKNILDARHVISITNGGRVKINIGLFYEYIWQKNGLR